VSTPRTRQWLASGARVGGTIALVATFAVSFDASALGALATPQAAAWLGAALGAHAVGNLLNGLAWRHLLAQVGGLVSLRDAVVHDLISVFWSTVLPGGVAGEVVKGVRLARDTEPGTVAGVLLTARLIGGGLACALGLASLPFSGISGPYATLGAAALAATTGATAVGLVALRLGPAALARAAWLAHRLPRGRLPPSAALARAAALSLGTHITFAWMFVWCFRAADAPITFADAAAISALTSVAQLLPIAIGGIGVRELTIAGLGALLVAKPHADAAAIAITVAFGIFILAGAALELAGAAPRAQSAPP
jgi:uncharacterized membrane protein YbhN (UPF0104 family)